MDLEAQFEAQVEIGEFGSWWVHGHLRRQDGQEVAAIGNVDDRMSARRFPTHLLAPLILSGWTSDNPLIDAMNGSFPVHFKRTLEFIIVISPDTQERVKIVAEGTIRNEPEGFRMDLKIANPGRTIRLTMSDKLGDIVNVLPFVETLFDAAPKEEVGLNQVRVLDGTASVHFLTQNYGLLAARLWSTWRVEIPKAAMAFLAIMETPLVEKRQITCVNPESAFDSITMRATSSVDGQPIHNVADDVGDDDGETSCGETSCGADVNDPVF